MTRKIIITEKQLHKITNFSHKTKNTIKEGLVRTYPTEKTISYIKNTINKSNIKGGVKINITDIYGGLGEDYEIADSIEVKINSSIVDNAYDLIKKLFDSCGYYETLKRWTKTKKTLIIVFEPKFPDESYSANDLSDNFYHITTLQGWDKIQKMGFVPRGKNSIYNYPPRCYFFIEDDFDLMTEFMSQNKLKRGDKAVILTLDTSKIKKDVRFWIDKQFIGGDVAVYTYENIPPNTIIDAKEIVI